MANGEIKTTKMIIDAALAAGYSVQVYDEDELSIRRTRDRTELVRGIAASDEQQYVMYDEEGRNRGAVNLVFGNEPGVLIQDHSMVLTQLLAEASAYQASIAE